MAAPQAFENALLDVSFPNTVSQVQNQYLCMAPDGSGNVILNTTKGAACLGILQNDPPANYGASVRIYGVSKAVAGAAITAGQRLTSDTAGRVIPCTVETANTGTGATTGSFQIGIALQAATAAGQLIAVAVFPGGAIPGTAG